MVFIKGHKINVGRKLDEERRKKLSINRRGENNPAWKGDKVGYFALHKWVSIHNPKPNSCEKCQSTKKLDLSNKDGQYLRDFDNWLWLCRSCHRKHDNRIPPTFKGRKHTEETKVKIGKYANKRVRGYHGMFLGNQICKT